MPIRRRSGGFDRTVILLLLCSLKVSTKVTTWCVTVTKSVRAFSIVRPVQETPPGTKFHGLDSGQNSCVNTCHLQFNDMTARATI